MARLASDRRPNQVIEQLAVQAKYAGTAWLLMDGAEGDSLPEELALCVAAQAKAFRLVPCPRPRYLGPRCTAPSYLPVCNSSTRGEVPPGGRGVSRPSTPLPLDPRPEPDPSPART